MELKWTKEIPKQPGWFWMRENGYGPVVVEIDGSLNAMLLNLPNGQIEDLRFYVSDSTEWCGPIELPE